MHAIFYALILGITQGLTEFLPISSTAHLVLLERLFRLDPQAFGLGFDVFINLGTTVALLLYFKQDLWSIFSKLRIPKADQTLSPEQALPWWIIGSTAVVGVIGLTFQSKIETVFRTPSLIALMLIGFGLLMLLAEKWGSQVQTSLNRSSAYAMGVGQALALIPGVSRSGVTISIGLFTGLARAQAAKYAFLLSAPITTLAILKSIFKTAPILVSQSSPVLALSYLVGAIAAGAVGYYSIKYLMHYLSHAPLTYFAYYRIALGVLVLLWIL